jgi:hypothetical protein
MNAFFPKETKLKNCPKEVENRIEKKDRIKSDIVCWGYVKVLVDPLFSSDV